MKRNLLIVLVIIIMCGCLSATLSVNTPLPSDISIISPDPSLPEEVRALSGKWVGQWNAGKQWGWDCAIYVEKVDKDSAQVVHSWGDYTTRAGSCHCAADWRRIQEATVTYSEGKATLEFLTPPYRPLKGPNPSHVLTGSREPGQHRYIFSFTLEKNKPDTMDGHFLSAKNSPLWIQLKKID
jgi:predicted dehydrogenase